MKDFFKTKVGARVYRITFAVLYIVTIIVIVALATAVDDYAEAERGYDDLRQYAPPENYVDIAVEYFPTTPEPDSNDSPSPHEDYDEDSAHPPGIKLAPDPRLAEINSDYAGWIRIDGTRIDYPLVQSNNEKYLTTTFWGTNNNAGTLFIDSRNTQQFGGTFAMIHGHNSRTGAMFGTLNRFGNSGFMQQNQNITIFNRDGEILTYRIFAAFSTTIHNQLYSLFATDDDFIKSFFTSVGAPAGSSRFLVLSTCTTSESDEDRTVVFAASIS